MQWNDHIYNEGYYQHNRIRFRFLLKFLDMDIYVYICTVSLSKSKLSWIPYMIYILSHNCIGISYISHVIRIFQVSKINIMASYGMVVWVARSSAAIILAGRNVYMIIILGMNFNILLCFERYGYASIFQTMAKIAINSSGECISDLQPNISIQIPVAWLQSYTIWSFKKHIIGTWHMKRFAIPRNVHCQGCYATYIEWYGKLITHGHEVYKHIQFRITVGAIFEIYFSIYSHTHKAIYKFISIFLFIFIYCPPSEGLQCLHQCFLMSIHWSL